MEKKIAATNRKAFHNYHISETIEAGIILKGFEVKSLRTGQANITDGIVRFSNDEAYLENAHIAPYKQQSTHVIDYSPTAKRKLLLHSSEIAKLKSKTAEKGFTIVPLEMYFNPGGKVKVIIGIGKGKKSYDKRESIKKRDTDREIRKHIKSINR